LASLWSPDIFFFFDLRPFRNNKRQDDRDQSCVGTRRQIALLLVFPQSFLSPTFPDCCSAHSLYGTGVSLHFVVLFFLMVGSSSLFYACQTLVCRTSEICPRSSLQTGHSRRRRDVRIPRINSLRFLLIFTPHPAVIGFGPCFLDP